MPTPTRIIQPRQPAIPCCGGIIQPNNLIFGSSAPPCTPTTIDLITDGAFNNAANWPFQAGTGGLGQSGIITGGQLTYPDWGSAPNFQAIDDGYFQALPSLVSTRAYTLTITKNDSGFGDPPPQVFIIFQSSDGFYTAGNLISLNGTLVGTINAGSPTWIAGAEPTYFPSHGSLGATDYGVLIIIQQSGTVFDGGFIDDFSLTYEECI